MCVLYSANNLYDVIWQDNSSKIVVTMSLTVQQLLNDAKRLSNRLREHDASADNVISSTQSVLKEMEAMRQYQEDIDSLNSIAHNRPRAQLVLGILS